MGLFRRLFRTDETPELADSRSGVEPLGGTDTLQVVGEGFRQDALWSLVAVPRGSQVNRQVVATLVAEPDNEADPDAVAVYIEGQRVGYLSRSDAARYRPGIVELQRSIGQVHLHGVISGGGFRGEEARMLGVFLSHDPADFGVARVDDPPAQEPGSIRTGFSEALVTDEDDDSYDLSWSDSLSTDRMRRIAQLRRLLDDERDPIDRHYMLSMLASDLYTSRDAFGSALDDFDTVCEGHHAELDATIRDALVTKFGAVPLLSLYKQAAIREQKRGDHAAALRWVERGIVMYGDQAARTEHVDDLNKRADKYRTKLTGTATPSKPRTPRPAQAPTTETLTCGDCGIVWERTVTRGRKPHICPDCRQKRMVTTPEYGSE